MSAEDVLALLGKPTYDDEVGPKSPDAPQDFHRVLRYSLRKFEGGGNSADEYISVVFDKQQKVQAVSIDLPPLIM